MTPTWTPVFTAYAYRDGEIAIKDPDTPLRRADAALAIVGCTDRAALAETISAVARHAYDGKILLVPGIPEAGTEFEAYAALAAFQALVQERLDRRQAEEVAA